MPKYKIGDRVRIVPSDKDYCKTYAGTQFVRDIQNPVEIVGEFPYVLSPEYCIRVRVPGSSLGYNWRVPESWIVPIDKQMLFDFMYEKEN